ncbi:hypothetical protein PENTCL1PPCAC_24479, partial [Pristionchus entomophagus]
CLQTRVKPAFGTNCEMLYMNGSYSLFAMNDATNAQTAHRQKNSLVHMTGDGARRWSKAITETPGSLHYWTNTRRRYGHTV